MISLQLGPCWEWVGAHQTYGYGSFRYAGRSQLAHRIAYFLLHGPMEEGLDLDHLCRNPGCVNPAHLELVPHRENVRRGKAGLATGAKQRAKTHCPHGHPYDEENTYRYRGGRHCIACKRAKKAAQRRSA
jgi:HNH endonuclease